MKGRAKPSEFKFAERGLFLEKSLVVKSDRKGSGHGASTETEGKLDEEHARAASVCLSAIRAWVKSEYGARACCQSDASLGTDDPAEGSCGSRAPPSVTSRILLRSDALSQTS